MVFIYPILNWVNHILSVHCLIGSSYITTTWTVKELTTVHSVVVTRNCIFKTRICCVICVVINYIHNNRDTGIMKCLNHCFHFLNSYCTVIWVSRERTFRNIVVHWIITPVLTTLCFINWTKVIHWHNLNTIDFVFN